MEWETERRSYVGTTAQAKLLSGSNYWNEQVEVEVAFLDYTLKVSQVSLGMVTRLGREPGTLLSAACGTAKGTGLDPLCSGRGLEYPIGI